MPNRSTKRADADDHQDQRNNRDADQGVRDGGEGAAGPHLVSALIGMGGEGLYELTRLPLGDCRVTGCGGDRRSDVGLWKTVLSRFGRLEGVTAWRAHGIVGLALDLASKPGSKLA